MPVYKDLHFNRDLSATKKLQVTQQLALADLTAVRLDGITQFSFLRRQWVCTGCRQAWTWWHGWLG
jgi:hypothetical protein